MIVRSNAFNSPLNQTLGRQVTGFLAAGGLATAIHWASMALLVLAGLPALTATAIGSICGAVTNYFFQRRLAFPGAGSHQKTVWRYVLSCLLAWVTNFVVFSFLQQGLLLSVTVSQLATTAAVALLNFTVYQRLVFHEKI